MEADGLLVGEFEVCESMEEVVVLVAQEQLYLLYWSWIGDSSLPVLNRGMEHLCDVDDHIWTWAPSARLSTRQSVETTVEAKRLRQTDSCKVYKIHMSHPAASFFRKTRGSHVFPSLWKHCNDSAALIFIVSPHVHLSGTQPASYACVCETVTESVVALGIVAETVHCLLSQVVS